MSSTERHVCYLDDKDTTASTAPPVCDSDETRQLEAFRRIYMKYGHDLSSFLKDVDEELTLKRSDDRRHSAPIGW